MVSKIQTITENNQEQLATLLLHIRQVLGDSAPLHFQASAAVTLNYFQRALLYLMSVPSSNPSPSVEAATCRPCR